MTRNALVALGAGAVVQVRVSGCWYSGRIVWVGRRNALVAYVSGAGRNESRFPVGLIEAAGTHVEAARRKSGFYYRRSI